MKKETFRIENVKSMGLQELKEAIRQAEDSAPDMPITVEFIANIDTNGQNEVESHDIVFYKHVMDRNQ